jgi:pyridoxamine 5'-phosphate oxidase
VGSEHEHPPLRRAELATDPVAQFERWFADAGEHLALPEAMTLATVDEDGAADARMVLLKGHGPEGFRFFTNYESAKGGQLAADARAALVFYWAPLDRQVRVRGAVEQLPAAESDAYFATRPRDSQLAAWASPQSRELPDRESLERNLADVTARFEGQDVPRPPHWGGWIVRHQRVEFWQGRFGRLHDRFRYEHEAGGWRITRLAP